VGIARALAARPALLLSDEATSALDPETTRSILALLKDINRTLGLTIVLITHEMEVVRGIADRLVVIDAGRIVEEGPVWKVFSDPQSPVTKSLLAASRPRLPENIAARISDRPEGEAVLRVEAAGPTADAPFLAELSSAVAGGFRLIHGGVDHIQDQPVASLFIGVPAAQTERAVAFLKSRGIKVELLGHVQHDV